jgi:hypothetical protein
MKNILVNTLVGYWDSPKWIRKSFAALAKSIILSSSNPRCKEYLAQISDACKQNNLQENKSLRNDILMSFIMTGSSPVEYFLYEFQTKSWEERDEFLTDAYRTQLQKKVIGLNLFKTDLINKYNFYSKNKEFFKRKCIKVSAKTTYEEFEAFVKEQGSVFMKLNAGSFGYNAHKQAFIGGGKLKTAFNDLHLDTGAEWIAEGLVVQDDRMSVWNSSSVNTIRIPSFLVNGHSVVFRPFIRTGRAGAVVDNAGAGGIFAVIDEESGKIITDGADESYNRYPVHPDCGIAYKGWQVPMWKELLAIVDKAHQTMPNHKYIAYDFALTKDGWVMIEGNWGQYVCQQTATKVGAKKKFKELIQSK